MAKDQKKIDALELELKTAQADLLEKKEAEKSASKERKTSENRLLAVKEQLLAALRS